MQTRGQRTLPHTKLGPQPRSRPHPTPIAESDPIEALYLVPVYLVIIAWILYALGLWNS